MGWRNGGNPNGPALSRPIERGQLVFVETAGMGVGSGPPYFGVVEWDQTSGMDLVIYDLCSGQSHLVAPVHVRRTSVGALTEPELLRLAAWRLTNG